MPTINRLKKVKEKKIPYKHYNQSTKYYNNSLWYHLREWYIKNHPLCERCLDKGIVKEAEDCHHKIPFLTGDTDEERWKLLLDEDNLQSLCSKCHTEIHNERNKLKNKKKNTPPYHPIKR